MIKLHPSSSSPPSSEDTKLHAPSTGLWRRQTLRFVAVLVILAVLLFGAPLLFRTPPSARGTTTAAAAEKKKQQSSSLPPETSVAAVTHRRKRPLHVFRLQSIDNIAIEFQSWMAYLYRIGRPIIVHPTGDALVSDALVMGEDPEPLVKEVESKGLKNVGFFQVLFPHSITMICVDLLHSTLTNAACCLHGVSTTNCRTSFELTTFRPSIRNMVPSCSLFQLVPIA